MSKIEDGGPAFPRIDAFEPGDYGETSVFTTGGMTLRQYAAIHLRQPNSGVDWLDEMIREAARDDFAAKAMQGICAGRDEAGQLTQHGSQWIAYEAYGIADAMLAAREAKS